MRHLKWFLFGACFSGCLLEIVQTVDAVEPVTIQQTIRRELSNVELSQVFTGRSQDHVKEWQSSFGANLQELLGPTEPPKQWQTVIENGKRFDDHIRYQITLKAEGVPALPLYLLIPSNGNLKPKPAVVAVHGHGPYGHHAVAGRDDLPGVAAAITKANYDYGRQFVRRGFVVAVPCMIPFGDRVDAEKYSSDPCAVSLVRLLALGKLPIAENVRDLRWAVSFLQSRSEVEAKLIGCAGLSYGGRMTMLVTAVDHRIKVAAVSGALNLMQERLSQRYSCGAQIIPRLLQYGDYSEIGGLIAPRPCVWQMGSEDALVVKNGWDTKFKQRLQRVYKAAGVSDNLHLDHFQGGHRWNGDVAFKVFDAVLQK